ncbi:MAG: response regulator [Spirochaetota bacterium]
MDHGGGAHTILLCEDEHIVALAQKSVLERAGYPVTIASNGEQVLQILADGAEPDLVLMDIDLGGGMDGTEAAEHIVERYAIPVVFLSAHTEPEVVEKTEGITSYGYVVKHSGETVLLASIRMAFRLFETRRRQREAEEQLRTQNRYLELYRTAVDGMEDYKIAVVDSSYIYRVASRQFAEKYRMPVSRIVGRSIADLVGQEVFENKIRPFIDRALAGESLEFRNWFDFPNIGPRYMRVKYYPLPEFDANDTAVAVVIQELPGP